jgi:hypothetical protein
MVNLSQNILTIDEQCSIRCVPPGWVAWSIVNLTYTASCGWWPQIFAIAAPIILTIYQSPTKSEPPSKSEKNFYYWFYPIHMAMLAALKTLL